jgi:hypothetical protein
MSQGGSLKGILTSDMIRVLEKRRRLVGENETRRFNCNCLYAELGG